MAEALRPLAGTPYDLVRLVGKGSMGEVYEAVHRTLGKRRAVKILAEHLVNRPDLAERMRVEAQLLANIRHPNLVEVVDLGVSADGRLYFVMDLLEGHTLRRTIEANSPMRASLALELLIPILDGLAAAHAAGVVHRDVKPENVFVLATGDIKVLDFGVAKVGLTAATVTKSNFSAGTPRYMAPEQIDGGVSDPRTDVFACGALLQELLTGKGPFDREERMALAFAILTTEPVALESPHRISRRVREAVARALRKKKEERFQSATEMATELRACLVEESGTVANTVSLPSGPRSAPPSAPPVNVTVPVPVAVPVSAPAAAHVPAPVSVSAPPSVPPSAPTRAGSSGAVVALVSVVVAVFVVGAIAIGWYAAKPPARAASATASVSVAVTVPVSASVGVSAPVGVTVSVSASESASANAPASASAPAVAPVASAARVTSAAPTPRHSSAPPPSATASGGPSSTDALRRPGSGL